VRAFAKGIKQAEKYDQIGYVLGRCNNLLHLSYHRAKAP
jgi:hypothetical protein